MKLKRGKGYVYDVTHLEKKKKSADVEGHVLYNFLNLNNKFRLFEKKKESNLVVAEIKFLCFCLNLLLNYY